VSATTSILKLYSLLCRPGLAATAELMSVPPTANSASLPPMPLKSLAVTLASDITRLISPDDQKS